LVEFSRSYQSEVVVSTFLTTIVLWLSANFSLPATHEHPRVEFVPLAKITELRYKEFGGAPLQLGEPNPQEASSVVSVYDNATRTIYLPQDWSGNTPAELSILVHEMVHHLQNAGNLKFECPQEREQLAYRAQEQWLRLFGRDLLQDFEVDPFTLLVRTRCAY
jgi:hypothetical protein